MSSIQVQSRSYAVFCALFVLTLLLVPTVLAEDAGSEEESAPKVDFLNVRQPMPDLLTGGQPTLEELAKAAEAGYTTVITLRRDGEIDWDEKAEVEKLGMRFVHLPIGREDVTEESARALAEALETEGPVLLHCGSGNRVGALLALKAFHVDGKDADAALEFGREAGLTSLEDQVKELLASE